MRGIKNPYTLLVKAGISSHSASDLLKSNVRGMRLDHLEKVCILLNCTPNDLLVWKKDTDTSLSEKHALNTLRHEGEDDNLYETLGNIPFSELKNIAVLVHNSTNSIGDDKGSRVVGKED